MVYKIVTLAQAIRGGEKMKKWLIARLCMFSLVGCSIRKDMTNAPTKKVEAYMDGYQKLDSSVLNDLDTLLQDVEYTVELKCRYKELMKKHYKDINYEIKEEKINGDKATVEVEVEVKDYSKVLSSKDIPDEIKDEEGNYSEEAYYTYQLDQMEKVSEKVKYTVTFYLTKVDKEWQIDDLNESTMQKIHGIYIY